MSELEKTEQARLVRHLRQEAERARHNARTARSPVDKEMYRFRATIHEQSAEIVSNFWKTDLPADVQAQLGAAMLRSSLALGYGPDPDEMVELMRALDLAAHPWGKPGDIPGKPGPYWVCIGHDVVPLPVRRDKHGAWLAEVRGRDFDRWTALGINRFRKCYRVRWTPEVP